MTVGGLWQSFLTTLEFKSWQLKELIKRQLRKHLGILPIRIWYSKFSSIRFIVEAELKWYQDWDVETRPRPRMLQRRKYFVNKINDELILFDTR